MGTSEEESPVAGVAEERKLSRIIFKHMCSFAQFRVDIKQEVALRAMKVCISIAAAHVLQMPMSVRILQTVR